MKQALLLLLTLLLLIPAAYADTQENDEMQVVVENQVLSYGDFGEEVAQLQLKLSKLNYYDGEITGSYGNLTRAAVKAFQADFSLLQVSDM